MKTGYLLGSTPRLQQISILFGAFASALVLGPILLVLNQGATVYVPANEVITAPASATEKPPMPPTVDAATLKTLAANPREKIAGVQASSDTRTNISRGKRPTT